jgi:hypothetical protein
MELNIRFTARLSEGLGRALVLIVTIIVVLVIRRAGYWPGTVLPMLLSAVFAASQASRVLLPGPGTVSLPGADGASPAGRPLV